MGRGRGTVCRRARNHGAQPTTGNNNPPGSGTTTNTTPAPIVIQLQLGAEQLSAITSAAGAAAPGFHVHVPGAPTGSGVAPGSSAVGPGATTTGGLGGTPGAPNLPVPEWPPSPPPVVGNECAGCSTGRSYLLTRMTKLRPSAQFIALGPKSFTLAVTNFCGSLASGDLGFRFCSVYGFQGSWTRWFRIPQYPKHPQVLNP